MNVFVLNTGRCGSMTFARACEQIANYTAAHESRVGLVGITRFDYPQNHIEVDNRLSWFLGRLDRRYGVDAAYVHLTRDCDATARSLVHGYSRGIMHAYRVGILAGAYGEPDRLAVARDYCDTVNANIAKFLEDKPRSMHFSLENASRDFRQFWSLIGAEGDLDAALAEFSTRHNAGVEANSGLEKGLFERLRRKTIRAARAVPRAIRDA